MQKTSFCISFFNILKKACRMDETEYSVIGVCRTQKVNFVHRLMIHKQNNRKFSDFTHLLFAFG